MDDRLTGWFKSVVAFMTKDLPYAGTYRYEVAGQNFSDQTLDLKQLNHTMGDLESVPMRVPGLRMEIRTGSEVIVGFVNNSPTGAYIAAYSQDPTDVTKVEIVGETDRNAREGDSVSVTIPIGAVMVPNVPPNPPSPGIPSSVPIIVTGDITSGSDKVSS